MRTKLKKRSKTIYCAPCKKWMTDLYVSRHVRSKSHFTKKVFKKVCAEEESFQLEGDTLKSNPNDESHEPDNVTPTITESKDDDRYYDEIPQNQLGVFGITDTIDYDALVQDDRVNTEQFQINDDGKVYIVENNPIQVVSGVFSGCSCNNSQYY